MSKALARTWCHIALTWMLLSPPAVSCIAQTENQPTPKSLTAEDSLKRFLQDYARSRSSADREVRYVDAFEDLNEDGIREAIVYIMGGGWCGSGGCIMLVLTPEPEGSSYRVVTKTTITRTPIRVLDRVSNGWHNLSVWVRGGGIRPGYEVELIFDGETYPTNPTAPPARPLKGKVPGRAVVYRGQETKLLYP